MNPIELLNKARNDEVSLGRLITLLETNPLQAYELLQHIYSLPEKRRAHIIGITGSGGVGKSTIISRLVPLIDTDSKIAILLIDPSSPISLGAVLGDRIRMQELTKYPNIFIRSCGTIGQTGGLNLFIPIAIEVLEALGFDIIILETPGIGQTQTDIREVADTVVLVFDPLSGDIIQALKSGITEVADIYAINKIDLPIDERISIYLSEVMNIESNNDSIPPPIIRISATTGQGISQLWESIQEYFRHLNKTGKISDRRGCRTAYMLRSIFINQLLTKLSKNTMIEFATKLSNGECEFNEAISSMLKIFSEKNL